MYPVTGFANSVPPAESGRKQKRLYQSQRLYPIISYIGQKCNHKRPLFPDEKRPAQAVPVHSAMPCRRLLPPEAAPSKASALPLEKRWYDAPPPQALAFPGPFFLFHCFLRVRAISMPFPSFMIAAPLCPACSAGPLACPSPRRAPQPVQNAFHRGLLHLQRKHPLQDILQAVGV